MIDKSESVNRANVWWILGANHLTFKGVMAGWFQKKKILQTDFERKKACKEIPGKNNILHWKKYILLMTYNAEKTSYTVIIMSGKKFLEVGEKNTYPN